MPRALRDLIEQARTWHCALPASIRSNELLTGGNRVLIEHGTQIYELRRTRQDKLILTK